MLKKVYPCHGFKALDEARGVFEAIVAVFGNVDSVGDKIIPGAFRKTLLRWKEKGRPIPVLFSHRWDDLDAHIGYVLEAKEVQAGLYVKAQLEMDEPFAARVWKKLRQGTLAEFSFAYDVVVSKVVNGINELRELELWEVGPTLVGANPETQLLTVKGQLEAGVPSRLTPQGARALIGALEDTPRTPGQLLAAIADLEKMSIGTPAEVRGQIAGLADPRTVKALIEESGLLTNLDILREACRQFYGPDVSQAWIDAMVAGEIARLIDDLARRQQQQFGGVTENFVRGEAEASIARWATAPAA